ncbi:hypothetical protein [Actinomadura decatromicini]|uniref:Uncharacterized protein n=1 Tax=Actinomadura decatromicini TaxID=2604572 RepID=A0A5D3FGE3_9ACTN|nr:hypothetical protein [Actinomadura decatromicini]TYK47159.1 hypothetical protein FXF68_25490 [Actinomadura decatromicini]
MATTYTIKAQNPEYSGEVAGVAFSRGVGEVTDPEPHVLGYFERHGYEVAKKGRRGGAAKPETDPKTDPNGDDPKE